MKFANRILIIILVVCVSFVGFVYIFFAAPESTLKGTLQVYPGSRLLFEDQATYGAGIAQKSLYYWITDSLGDVQKYYENTFPPFIAGNSERQWLITGFNVDGTKPNVANNSLLVDHESFCDFKQPFQCVTLALMEAGNSDLFTLPVISPSNFAYTTPPPNFASIPQQGTLIVYSYYIRVG